MIETKALPLIMAAVVLEVLGQLAFKRGTARVMLRFGAERAFSYWGRLALVPWIQFGVVVHFVELLLWIAALSLVPLSVAFPLASLSYVGVAVGGHYWLNEKLDRRAIAGIVLITIGVALICFPGA